MMNVLVTGGAGFIGSHLVDALLGQGHRVTVIDDLSTGQRASINPKASFVQMDIGSTRVADVFSRGHFEVVCHHAAQMNVRRSVSDPLFDAEVNILGTLNLLEHARRHGSPRFIFASSGGAIYGEPDVFPASEDHPLRPVSPYGVAKLSVEKYLSCYHAVHGLEWVALRYANVYGPRQSPHGEAGVVAIFCDLLANGGQPVINGDGKQTRDYVYVGDVVRANLLALGSRGCHTWNVGTGVEHDVNAVFHKLRAALGSDCPEVHGPAKAGEQTRSSVDPSRIAADLGWSPRVGLDEGLRMTAGYFRDRRAAA